MDTSNISPVPAQASQEKSRQSSCGAWVFALVILGLGGVLGWVGGRAVSTGHYEMTWRTSGSFGSDRGMQIYDGADAVRAGAGLMAFGVMLMIWGIAIARAGRRQEGTGLKTAAGRAGVWVSFVCLLGSCACLVPPWHLRNWPFWAVVVLITDFGLEATECVRDRWAKRLMGGLVLATIVASGIDAKFGMRMMLGIFASFFVLAHLALVVPRFGRTLRRG